MRKYKLLAYVAISCLMIVSFLSACATSSQKATPNKIVNAEAALAKNYRKMADLAKDAKEIVEIKVNSQESITYGDVPFTISTVSVIKSFKGNHLKGDTIRIIETGGEFTPVDKQGNPLPKVTMTMNGVPVLQPNAHEVIFLDMFEGPQISGEVYVPLGVYQGRFKVDASGDMAQGTPDEEKLKDFTKTKIDKFADVLKNLSNQ